MRRRFEGSLDRSVVLTEDKGVVLKEKSYSYSGDKRGYVSY
jgi:hypothetical protein